MEINNIKCNGGDNIYLNGELNITNIVEKKRISFNDEKYKLIRNPKY